MTRTERGSQISEKERGKVQEHAVKALRCNVVRELTAESAKIGTAEKGEWGVG